MSVQDAAKKRKLLRDWSYFKPTGPHVGGGDEDMLKNLNEMDPRDVARLIEIGDEMAEYINNS